MPKVTMTEKQKEIVTWLADSLYTVQFLEEWLNRNDNVFANAPAALQAVGASGFFTAVKAIERAGYRDCVYMNDGACTGLNCCTERDCPEARKTQPWLFDKAAGIETEEMT